MVSFYVFRNFRTNFSQFAVHSFEKKDFLQWFYGFILRFSQLSYQMNLHGRTGLIAQHVISGSILQSLDGGVWGEEGSPVQV